jgi:rhodanese-related sulfurtransferase
MWVDFLMTGKKLLCTPTGVVRGYEAAVLLNAYGYTSFKVMEGGIMAWPFEKESKFN